MRKLLLTAIAMLAVIALAACETGAGPTATPASLPDDFVLPVGWNADDHIVEVPYLDSDEELLNVTIYQQTLADAWAETFSQAAANALAWQIADLEDTGVILQETSDNSIRVRDAAESFDRSLDTLEPFYDQLLARLTADPEIIVREPTQGELDVYFCNRLVEELNDAVEVQGNYIGPATAGYVEVALCRPS